METQNSALKIEAVKGIAAKSSLFITDGCEALVKLKGATETIGVPLFDSIYNHMVSTMRAGTEMVHNASNTMAGMCDDWGSRSGFGAKAAAAFEEAKTTAQAVLAVEFTGAPCAESDGLHENVSAETIGAFTNALVEFIQVKNNFIYGVAGVSQEFSTKDTESIFQEIGGGMETFTNSIVDVIDGNKEKLAAFGVNLEEVASALNAKASEINEEGSKAAKSARASEDL